MKVYLAAMYSKRDELREYASELRDRGFVVTSRWLEERHNLKSKTGQKSPEDLEAIAKQDREDIRHAETFVLFTPTLYDLLDVNGMSLGDLGRLARAGHEWECGYAYALRKRIIIVGERVNAFHFNPEIEVYPTWQEALNHLCVSNIQCTPVYSSTSQTH